MSEQLIWTLFSIYALVLMFALYMTRGEQVRNGVSWKTAIFGFLACLVWPVATLWLVGSTMLDKQQPEQD